MISPSRPITNSPTFPVYGDGIYGRNPHPGHTIAIVDLPSRKVDGTIDVSPYQAPHGIQIDDAGTIYVTCDISRKLLVIDPEGAQNQSRHRHRWHRPLGRRSARREQSLRRE